MVIKITALIVLLMNVVIQFCIFNKSCNIININYL